MKKKLRHNLKSHFGNYTKEEFQSMSNYPETGNDETNSYGSGGEIIDLYNKLKSRNTIKYAEGGEISNISQGEPKSKIPYEQFKQQMLEPKDLGKNAFGGNTKQIDVVPTTKKGNLLKNFQLSTNEFGDVRQEGALENNDTNPFSKTFSNIGASLNANYQNYIDPNRDKKDFVFPYGANVGLTDNQVNTHNNIYKYDGFADGFSKVGETNNQNTNTLGANLTPMIGISGFNYPKQRPEYGYFNANAEIRFINGQPTQIFPHLEGGYKKYIGNSGAYINPYGGGTYNQMPYAGIRGAIGLGNGVSLTGNASSEGNYSIGITKDLGFKKKDNSHPTFIGKRDLPTLSSFDERGENEQGQVYGQAPDFGTEHQLNIDRKYADGGTIFDNLMYQGFKNRLPKNQQSDADYDLKGFYEENPTFNTNINGEHFTDKFKLPNSKEGFSNESQYYKPGMKAGVWNGENYKEFQPNYIIRNTNSMYADGGTVKPYITHNPNDPRIQAYKDSILLSNIVKEDRAAHNTGHSSQVDWRAFNDAQTRQFKNTGSPEGTTSRNNPNYPMTDYYLPYPKQKIIYQPKQSIIGNTTNTPVYKPNSNVPVNMPIKKVPIQEIQRDNLEDNTQAKMPKITPELEYKTDKTPFGESSYYNYDQGGKLNYSSVKPKMENGGTIKPSLYPDNKMLSDNTNVNLPFKQAPIINKTPSFLTTDPQLYLKKKKEYNDSLQSFNNRVWTDGQEYMNGYGKFKKTPENKNKDLLLKENKYLPKQQIEYTTGSPEDDYSVENNELKKLYNIKIGVGNGLSPGRDYSIPGYKNDNNENVFFGADSERFGKKYKSSEGNWDRRKSNGVFPTSADTFALLMNEAPHMQQGLDKDGLLKNDKITSKLKNYENSYDTPGTVEYEAHKIIQPQLAYIYNRKHADRVKEDFNEEDIKAPYTFPNYSSYNGWMEVHPDSSVKYINDTANARISERFTRNRWSKQKEPHYEYNTNSKYKDGGEIKNNEINELYNKLKQRNNGK